MSIVESMNRINAKKLAADAAVASMKERMERFLKWHPQAEDVVCEHCAKVFDPRMKVIRQDNGSIRQVVVTAKVRKQIHDMAYSYNGQTGMCGLTEAERRRALADG